MKPTLATINNFSRQEIFNFVATHLLTQGKQSYDRNTGTCQYRGPGGRKCAVGALIGDEAYHPGMEGAHVKALVKEHKIEAADDMVDMLWDLQHIHDRGGVGDAVGYWKRSLSTYASNNGLSDAVVLSHGATIE